MTLDAKCPSCQAPNLVLRSMVQDMPYFGETLHSVVECPRCDFRHANSMVLAQREPARHILRLRTAPDLDARVARSPTGTYRVPELGFSAEPGEASESFVSNVQGVLERIREVLLRVRLLADDDAKRLRAEELLVKLQRILDSEEDATLILEDPYGNSAILGERVEIEKLAEDEVAQLRTGIAVLDLQDLSGD